MSTSVLSVLKQRTSVRFGQITCAAMAVLLPLTASAHADSLTLTKLVSAKEQKTASSYWTRERIASAPALRLPVDSGVGTVDATAVEEAEVTGPLGSEAPGMADPDASRIARIFYPQDWAILDKDEKRLGEPAITGTAGVYTSYDVNTKLALWQIYPHRWSGKLTFIKATGGASCSATAISGNNIVTAAHCVYDTVNNVYYSNWVFTPAYRNGSAPYGTFTAKACTILAAWANLSGSFSINSWTRYDVAVCTLNSNSAGQTLNSAVGFAGRLWNAGNNQLVFNSGYPAFTVAGTQISNGPTQYLRSCTAETFLQSTDTLGSGCNWGSGISGGSWLVGYKPFVVSGQVNSVNSGGYFGQQNIYGAKFTSDNIVVVCNDRGC